MAASLFRRALQLAVAATAGYQLVQGKLSLFLLPVVVYVVFSFLDGSENTAKVGCKGARCIQLRIQTLALIACSSLQPQLQENSN